MLPNLICLNCNLVWLFAKYFFSISFLFKSVMMEKSAFFIYILLCPSAYSLLRLANDLGIPFFLLLCCFPSFYAWAQQRRVFPFFCAAAKQIFSVEWANWSLLLYQFLPRFDQWEPFVVPWFHSAVSRSNYKLVQLAPSWICWHVWLWHIWRFFVICIASCHTAYWRSRAFIHQNSGKTVGSVV